MNACLHRTKIDLDVDSIQEIVQCVVVGEIMFPFLFYKLTDLWSDK